MEEPELKQEELSYLEQYESILHTMIFEMDQAEQTLSISHDFIVQMLPHHRAAIAMSEALLQVSQQPQLREIAKGILAEQTQSIKNLEEVLPSCSNLENCRRSVCAYRRSNRRILDTMFFEMRRASTDQRVDCDFMREMIPHHRGAVRMSRNALQYRICPQLIPILERIITSQEAGIHQMQQLLRMLNCAC